MDIGELPHGAKIIRERSLQREKVARQMWEKGYSVRQVMEALGLKSSSTAFYYINGRKRKAPPRN